MKRCNSMSGLAALFALAVTAGQVTACAIPVFRYALERWQPDNYQVVILHRGPLGQSDLELVDRLRKAASDPTQPANLDVVMRAAEPTAAAEPNAGVVGTAPIPPDAVSPPPQEDRRDGPAAATEAPGTTAADSGSPEAPRMTVFLPVPTPEPWEVWSGPLTEQNVQRLVDSPARRTIAERLLAGESAVWVFVACGDEAKDGPAEATLRAELARMEKLLQLPAREVLEAEREFRPDTPVQLRIGFSLVRIGKDDPDETIFRAMLLASEPDLVDFQEPIAIPIYGRGRTGFALVGKGIHADTVEENCRFLCDGCSCVVKHQNPGVDMLFAVNWAAHVEGSAMPDLVLPELTGIGSLAATDPALPAVGNAAPAAPAVPATPAPPEEAAPPAAPNAVADVADAAPAAPTATAAAEPQPHTMARPDGPAGDEQADAVPAVTSEQFARRLLTWTLAGAGVAALLVLISSRWLTSRAS